MSEQIISLTSSDEENTTEPPPKKKKLTRPLTSEVTLTLVPTVKKKKADIETVTLDSDDEVDQTSESNPEQTNTNSENGTANNIGNADLITLTDDEDNVEPQIANEVNAMIESVFGADAAKRINVFKRNGLSVIQNKAETVAIIDSDSDNDIEKIPDKPIEGPAETSTDTNKNIVAKPTTFEIDTDPANDKINKSPNRIPNETSGNDANETVLKDLPEKALDDLIEGVEEELEKDIALEGEKIVKPVEEEQSKTKHEEISLASFNSSIVINDSDEETEKENHCEIVDIEPLEKTGVNNVPGPSILLKGELAEARAAFKKFLKMIEEKILGSSFEEILPKKLPIIQKYFKKCGTYVNQKDFEILLNRSTESVKKAPTSNAANTALLEFHRIFGHLKSHATGNTIEIEEDHVPKVKKLEKTIRLLRKKIKELEEAEVNFDDDEDSAYIMLDRYQARLNKVYAKYCQYIRRNPYSGRAIYDKISFVTSKYNEINLALSKRYKNSVNFPSYYELEKYIEKIVKKENLELSPQEIKQESKKCFKYLGNILQKKRRQELYDSHLDFIEFTEDPAAKDVSLENVLRKNYSEGKEKIEKLYQRYVDKQEQGEDHISSDSEATSSEGANMTGKNSRKKVKKKPLITAEKTDEENEIQKVNEENNIEEILDNGIQKGNDGEKDSKTQDTTEIEYLIKDCEVAVTHGNEDESSDKNPIENVIET